MIYNEKLTIADYIKTVEEITHNFFKDETGEYFPHYGNIYCVYLYFMNCVTPEDGDPVTKESIVTVDENGVTKINFDELQKLFDDEEFMENYNGRGYLEYGDYSLDFFCARDDALKIVESKLSSANGFAIAVSSALKTVLEAFSDSFSDDKLKTLGDLAQQIINGKLNEDAIVEAYSKSDRFTQRTKEVEEESKIIRLPEKRDKN